MTGIREGEVVAFGMGSLEGTSGARRLQVVGKGNKGPGHPHRGAREKALEAYLATRRARFPRHDLYHPATAVFVDVRGRGLSVDQVEHLIERLYIRAGLRAQVPAGALVHALRHTLCHLRPGGRRRRGVATGSAITDLWPEGDGAVTGGRDDAPRCERRRESMKATGKKLGLVTLVVGAIAWSTWGNGVWSSDTDGREVGTARPATVQAPTSSTTSGTPDLPPRQGGARRTAATATGETSRVGMPPPKRTEAGFSISPTSGPPETVVTATGWGCGGFDDVMMQITENGFELEGASLAPVAGDGSSSTWTKMPPRRCPGSTLTLAAGPIPIVCTR